MRSYYSHLNTTSSEPKGDLIQPRPVFRASAIFPAIHTEAISSRLLFMGYWLLKRNIPQIQCIVTLRKQDGAILVRKTFSISEAKAFRIELLPLLEEAGLGTSDFFGSLEVEFYSIQNLVFPFPAAVINYYGENFSTVVHTAQRVYNDFEDMKNNSQTKVPESGFTIYKDKEREPFISLINGGNFIPDSKMDLTFFNQHGKTFAHTIALGDLAPYQALFIYPAQEVPNLEDFLGGAPGTCKVHFEVSWIFPRLLVGNFLSHPSSLVITHTYYDCSAATQKSDYWIPNDPEWYPESLMIPVLETEKNYTRVALYPIYSPSEFYLGIEIYDCQGDFKGRLDKYLIVKSPADEFICIPFDKVLAKMNIKTSDPLAARIFAKRKDGGKIPARVKVSFDIGYKGRALPCNICTNLQPYNPSLNSKLQSFKWGPILNDAPHASIWIMNSQPKIEYGQNAIVKVAFYREEDGVSIERDLSIPPQGFILIEPEKDEELKLFLKNQIGWFTAISTNPYTTTYYFSMNESGVVGGDHGF